MVNLTRDALNLYDIGVKWLYDTLIIAKIYNFGRTTAFNYTLWLVFNIGLHLKWMMFLVMIAFILVTAL